MIKFTDYLSSRGIQFQTAYQYSNIVTKFLNWCDVNNLKVKQMKRVQFSEYLQYCRDQGNKERTIRAKEGVIKHYFDFLGAKNNPAKSWLRRKKEELLPPKAVERALLDKIYQELNPKTPVEYRDRCMLGMVLYQGLLRGEIQELRIGDFNFDRAEVFIQGQRRSNSRTLKLDPAQLFHLYDYLNKFRKNFTAVKDFETDKCFLSAGTGKGIHNSVAILVRKLKRQYPQIEDFRHIRGSVITHWQEKEGIVETMIKAGHRYISSTGRYQTNKYDELQDQLAMIHPLEKLKLTQKN